MVNHALPASCLVNGGLTTRRSRQATRPLATEGVRKSQPHNSVAPEEDREILNFSRTRSSSMPGLSGEIRGFARRFSGGTADSSSYTSAPKL